jgi:hypothetical protein
MRADGIVAVAAFAVAALLAWPAQAAPKAGQRVTATSCPTAGVTANCLIIKATDGTVYNITGANPRPRDMGRAIHLRGTVTDKVSICNQGIVLERIRWTRTRQRCSN